LFCDDGFALNGLALDGLKVIVEEIVVGATAKLVIHGEEL
jgi:hypothetical protein